MLIGVPGSGKSTWAEMQEKNGAAVVSSDRIRTELGLRDEVPADNEKCFRTVDSRVKELLGKGMDVIYDATNMSRKRRMASIQMFRKHADVLRCVLFTTPIETCIRRDAARDRHVGKEVILRMVRSFNAPWYYEGWDSIICMPNGEPARLKFDDMDQNNPHHKLTLDQHMAAAVSYTKTHCRDNQAVIRAAGFHDIGKHLTKTTDENGVSHYYGHENAGAYMFLSGIRDPGTEELYIANLINWHMAPLNRWKNSDAAKAKDRGMMGEKMFHDVMLLHDSDLAAH